jgi:hypothetical protein
MGCSDFGDCRKARIRSGWGELGDGMWYFPTIGRKAVSVRQKPRPTREDVLTVRPGSGRKMTADQGTIPAPSARLMVHFADIFV